MITRKIILFFFSSTLQARSVGIFHFTFHDLQNSVLWSPLFVLRSGLYNTHLHAQDDTVNMDIFLHEICSLLVFDMLFS